jgi:hypothetical protein
MTMPSMLWGATNTAMQAAWVARVEADASRLNLNAVAEASGTRDVTITGPQEDLDALMRIEVARTLPVR